MNYIFIFLILLLPMGLRYGIGTDYFYTYYPYFNFIGHGTRYFDEVGFNLLNIIVYKLFGRFEMLIFITSFLVENNIAKIILFILAFVLLIIGVSFALKIETETGYYECQKCHHKYVPKYSQVYFAMHSGTTRYMKCPKCNKKSWQRKTLS